MDRPTVVLAMEFPGCGHVLGRQICSDFRRAVARSGVNGRIVAPTIREDLVDTLNLLARQRYDLVSGFGFAFPEALDTVAPRYPRTPFALVDRSIRETSTRPRNLQGLVFRTSEAAYLAGWLAARMEQQQPRPAALGIVGGVPIPAVKDFIVGFRAGARAATPHIRIVTAYSGTFVDPSRCASIARRQVARGAGVLFNVAGQCGLGTLAVAKERRIWAVGVDTDQASSGARVLTSVLKRFDVAFRAVFRDLAAGRFRTGSDTVFDLGDGAVGLGRLHPLVPAAVRSELERIERKISAGEIQVPSAFPRGR